MQKEMATMKAKYKCEVCGKKVGEKSPDEKLIKAFELHHIEELQTILDKYNITTIDQALMCKEVWNCPVQILCKCCHKQTDSYGDRSHGGTVTKKYSKN